MQNIPSTVWALVLLMREVRGDRKVTLILHLMHLKRIRPQDSWVRISHRSEAFPSHCQQMKLILWTKKQDYATLFLFNYTAGTFPGTRNLWRISAGIRVLTKAPSEGVELFKRTGTFELWLSARSILFPNNSQNTFAFLNPVMTDVFLRDPCFPDKYALQSVTDISKMVEATYNYLIRYVIGKSCCDW